MKMKAHGGSWVVTTDDIGIWSIEREKRSVQLASLNSEASPDVNRATSLATAGIMAMSCDLARSLRDMVDAFICCTQWDDDLPLQVVRAKELLAMAEPLLPETSNELTARPQHAINADNSKEP